MNDRSARNIIILCLIGSYLNVYLATFTESVLPLISASIAAICCTGLAIYFFRRKAKERKNGEKKSG